MCRIWDEDSQDWVAYYRSTGPMKNKKNGDPHWGKPYSTPLKQYGNRPNNQRTIAMGFAMVVVANPLLSQLISLVTSVVSPGTTPQIMLIKAQLVSTVDRRGIFREIAHIPRRSRMVRA